MNDLLYLVHRIPFPPRKGDKVRSFNFLKHLSRSYRVHLAAFIDDRADLEHCDAVREMCTSAEFDRIRPRFAKAMSLRALASGDPLTVKYFASRRIERWVHQVMQRNQIQRVLVFSSSMAPFVAPYLSDRVRRGVVAPSTSRASGFWRHGVRSVIDFVDVDSEKWLSYGESHSGPVGVLYRREAHQLLSFEREMAHCFDASVFVSEDEAALFRRKAPEAAPRVHAVANGVDAEYFCADHDLTNPYPVGHPVGVFTGAMDYKANIDAAVWFARDVLPLVQAAHSDFHFYIVGANPAPAVRRLARSDGVTVTGTVDDIRPYIRYATVALAPLTVARGIQNKVLEAMAMARPVVASPAAMEGIEYGHGLGDLIGANAQEFAARVVQLVREPERGDELGRQAARFVRERYDWAASARQLVDILESNGEAQ